MAYEVLSYRHHVTSNVLQISPAVDVSRIVDVRGYNTAQVDLVVLNSDEVLEARVQGSDDLENWTTIATLGTSFAIGFALPSAVTSIGVSYLRLKFAIGGEGGIVIVAAGVNLTNL